MGNAELNKYAVIKLLFGSAKLSVRWVDLISYKVKCNLIFCLGALLCIFLSVFLAII